MRLDPLGPPPSAAAHSVDVVARVRRGRSAGPRRASRGGAMSRAPRPPRTQEMSRPSLGLGERRAGPVIFISDARRDEDLEED